MHGDMTSLLGQFYHRIRGAQEDIASEGLVYILQRSEAARLTLQQVIGFRSGVVLAPLHYEAQRAGEEQERPDITGLDEHGDVALIIEAKFWASLTPNQPLKYLERLGAGKVLLFICPSGRIRSLYDELRLRLKQSGLSFREDLQGHAFRLPDDRCLLVQSWSNILAHLDGALLESGERSLQADLAQIAGFCAVIDREAFVPLRSEDLSPAIARTVSSFYELADQVVDALKSRNHITTRGLNATGQKYGYTRYFKYEDMGVGLNIRFDLWARHADTPFWLQIKDDTSSGKNWMQTRHCRSALEKWAAQKGSRLQEVYRNEFWLALHPLTEQLEDMVVKDLCKQIMEVLANVREG